MHGGNLVPKGMLEEVIKVIELAVFTFVSKGMEVATR